MSPVSTNDHMSETDDSDESSSISSDDIEHGQHEYDFIGDILNNRYAIFYKLGSGAYSSVWLTYDIEEASFFALKIQYSKDYDEGIDEVAFLRKMSKRPHITQLLDAFVTVRQDNHYICMKIDICAGTLYDALKSSMKRYDRGLSLNLLQTLTRKLLDGIESIHQQGVIHTDIKPENILLTGHSKPVAKMIETFQELNFPKIYEELRAKYIVDKQLNTSNDKHKKKLRKEKGNLYRATLQIIMIALTQSTDSDLTSIDSTLSINTIESTVSDNNSVDGINASHDDSDDDSLDKLNSSQDGSDTSSCDDRSHFQEIDQELINRCDIRISDFGTIVRVKGNIYEEIQTRHYRAPEVILGLKYSQTCDVWSIGCMLYELYTGKVLFSPSKNETVTRDMQHLLDIHNVVGKFDKQMIKKSPRKKEFSQLSLTNTTTPPELDKLMTKSLESNHKHTKQLSDFLGFVKKCLLIDGTKRPSIGALKTQPFIIN